MAWFQSAFNAAFVLTSETLTPWRIEDEFQSAFNAAFVLTVLSITPMLAQTYVPFVPYPALPLFNRCHFSYFFSLKSTCSISANLNALPFLAPSPISFNFSDFFSISIPGVSFCTEVRTQFSDFRD